MEDYSIEMTNKNITQNNIEKIKRSMQKLKDTINRSKSNNYRNIKINSQKHYNNNIHNRIKDNIKEENKSVLYYNIKESGLNNNNNLEKIFSPNKNLYLNIQSPQIQHSQTNKKYLNMNKYIPDKPNKELNHKYILNHNQNYFSPLAPSRNKINKDFNSNNTDNLLDNKKENTNINIPKLTDYNNNEYNEENSFLNQIQDNLNNKDKKNFDIQLARNRSAKQMEIIENIINKNIDKREVFYTNENSISNIEVIEPTNIKAKKNFEKYLLNQINSFNKINKGLLIRYNNILKTYKSASEQNNTLINKINEIKTKEKNLKNDNLILEKEYNDIKTNSELNVNNNESNNENKLLLIKENEELKDKINKYDEMILELKNKINILINDEEN